MDKINRNSLRARVAISTMIGVLSLCGFVYFISVFRSPNSFKIAEILSNPDKYDGKTVSIRGRTNAFNQSSFSIKDDTGVILATPFANCKGLRKFHSWGSEEDISGLVVVVKPNPPMIMADESSSCISASP
jgi:hypothetical protein